MTPSTREPACLLAAGLVALIISRIGAYDSFTWFLEVLPIFIAAPILIATYSRFRFTPLVYRLIFIHALILMIGGHYTYARVPMGAWMQDLFGFARNDYDRIGHFAQGFIPAIVVREILLRQTPLRRAGWLFVLVVSVGLAASAFWEFLEWWSALALGESSSAFLGTQGDPWDTQSDLFMCFIGSIASLLIFSRLHDRQLSSFSVTPS